MKTVTVTNELIESGKTGSGGWTKIQLALIGVSWPPEKGWKFRAVGTQIPEADAKKFVALKKPTQARLEFGEVNEYAYDDEKEREFIVAEIGKNWPETGHALAGLPLAGLFEDVIEVNRARGYLLYSFQMHRMMTSPTEMNETIIAVFRSEKCQSSSSHSPSTTP